MVLTRKSRDGARLWIMRAGARSLAYMFGLIVLASMGAIQSANAGNVDRLTIFHIRAKSLQEALLEFGSQARLQIDFVRNDRGQSEGARKLLGRYTARDALTQLLKGTGLKFEVRGDTVRILSSAQDGASDPKAQRQRSEPKGPKASVSSRHGTKQPPPKPHKGGPIATLEEVVVTGSHISGRPPQSQPMLVFTRQQIEDSGYPTLQQFMTAIPQNLGAVGSGTTGLTDNGLASNQGFGSGVDLRGLGYESTLVLVNGHRLAPAGGEGAFTDISVLPLSAIQRVDVLTAGASAIYGSDAVGGVVNYVLRDELAGAETSVAYGSVTSGGLKDLRASQSLGAAWRNGGGFVSYEYHTEKPLAAADRAFSRSSTMEDLLPESKQHALFGTLHQDVGDLVRLSGDLFYADRHNHASFSEPVAPPVLTEEADTKEYDVSIGAQIRTESSWVINGRVGVGANMTQSQGATYFLRAHSKLLSAEATANGILWTLPAGAVRGAVGAQVLEQRLSQLFGGIYASVPPIDKSRSVSSIFAEARIPLLKRAQGAEASPNPALELDVAGRGEHYTDFGSSANPELGLAWWPLRGLKVRATWDSSFAAPQLWELSGPQYTTLVNSLTQTPPGKAAVLILSGANPALRAERSSQWTAGLDLTPSRLRALAVSLNYYRIHYRDRITSPSIRSLTALESGPTYEPFIQENPSSAEVSRLASAPFIFYDNTVIPLPIYGPPRSLGDVVAVVDNRVQNIGTTDTDGFDLASSFSSHALGYTYHLAVDGTYILHFRDTPRPGASIVSLLSTLNNPINFRARAATQVAKGKFSASAALNYYNHYADPTVFAAQKRIASWTTVDLGLRYRIRAHGVSESTLDNLDVFLSCTNCGDRLPPHVAPESDIFERGYDPANASPLGRFVSITLDAKW